MTRHDFLRFAIKNHPLNETEQIVGIDFYDPSKLELSIREEYHDKYNTEKILDFFEHIGRIYFHRVESISGDKLAVDVRWMARIYRWSDIGAVVNLIGFIENCAGRIDEFYMSENGEFYNRIHTLIAKTEEDFFDFLTTVEYDFHPVIKERVFEVLRKAGWYEGRRVDISAFNKEMKSRGITLSQAQLDFLSEFGGIHFSCGNEYCKFLSASDILNDCDFALDDDGNYSLMAVENIGPSYYIDYDGTLSGIEALPLGRTTMECVNHLVKNTFGWGRELDEPMNKPMSSAQDQSII